MGSSNLTRHHLLPKSRARKLRKKSKKLRKRDLSDADRTVDLCRPCHRNIHAHIENSVLEREYDTPEKLAAHPEVRRFTEWVKNRRNGVR
ncbi:hypothetical protein [Rubrobacter indicoceani]|uniref:hypothetical protein n=1 Tax=Rubrobacter indicoceani TaxID=2051957 RepID=UPI001968AE48|nr:hypothetical protein [Rubrobacter indicoceani]